MLEKKEKELSFLKTFLELDGIVVKSIGLPDPDPPDTEIRIGEKLISVEVTSLYRKHGERISKELALIEDFQRELIERSSRLISQNFSVLWEFDFPIDVRGAKKHALLEEMISIVQNVLETKTVMNGDAYGVESDLLPSQIDSFAVWQSDNLKSPLWRHPTGWFTGELRADEINRSVNKKNLIALDNGYTKNYHENWLLLVIEEEPYSSFADYKEGGYELDDSWIFDRIIIMEPKVEKRLYNLK